MKIKYILGFFILSSVIASCDDNTTDIGSSITDNMDHLQISTDTFEVTTRSFVAGSVYSRNTTGYLGKIRDPETGAYITGNFMTQFHTLEDYAFPEKDSIVSKSGGEVIADSCEIRLFYDSFYGDSLATMKLCAMELNKPMSEGVKYYSDFDPEANGLIRTNGAKIEKTYTLEDLNISEDVREDDDYQGNIRLLLNQPYTDKNGKTYNNYGTYIMRKYYEDPNNFKNSFNFSNNVVPGFYIKNINGLGSMAYIYVTQLNVYFKYLSNDTISKGTSSFAGTEEVLLSSTINNDNNKLQALAADNECTYLKTPAGIFTEMTLPIDDIMNGHDNDTLNTAKVALQRINDTSTSKYNFKIPQTLLMIAKDSLKSFFENNEIANYKTSYLASFDTSSNSYVFNNISGLVKDLYSKRNSGSANWNKVVLVPVTTTYITVNSSSRLTKIVHDMSLTSTKLVGGTNNKHEKIKLSVIYSKFK